MARKRYDDDDDDRDDVAFNRPAEDVYLSPLEIVLAIFCSSIGCILGIVYLVQGKPKAGKLIGLSIVFNVLALVVTWIVAAMFG